MSVIEIGRYQNDTGWKGWIAGQKWIIFEHMDGRLFVFNGRTKTGAVTGEPVII